MKFKLFFLLSIFMASPLLAISNSIAPSDEEISGLPLDMDIEPENPRKRKGHQSKHNRKRKRARKVAFQNVENIDKSSNPTKRRKVNKEEVNDDSVKRKKTDSESTVQDSKLTRHRRIALGGLAGILAIIGIKYLKNRSEAQTKNS